MNLEPRTNPEAKSLTKEEFKERFSRRFIDPIYDDHRTEIEALAELAWKAHEDNHKSPMTSKAGEGFADPDYELSDEWRAASLAIKKAQALQKDPQQQSHVLLISAADRNDKSCPGEVSKTRRLVALAKEAIEAQGIETQILDLSEVISEYGKHIFPCKACVSTSMPLCHWPCSCYPNYAVDQMHDWMNEIYPMWARAHGVMIITPVYWYQAPSALKLMMDRLVCADGGNPDPTTTQGKKAKLAKEIEMKGWDYPKHLEGRLYSVVVHGDAEGANQLRSNLQNWLTDLHLLPASISSSFDRYIGYYEPYATSHQALDRDEAIQQEVRNAASELAQSVKAARAGQYKSLMPRYPEPRAK